jgi:type IV pilus assembly protein PilM
MTQKSLPVKNIQPEQLEAGLNVNIQNLLEEIEKTFSFYEASNTHEKKIEFIFLSGGLSKLKDLKNNFDQKFNIKTEILNPFLKITHDGKKFDPIYFDEMAPLFGVSAGLKIK